MRKQYRTTKDGGENFRATCVFLRIFGQVARRKKGYDFIPVSYAKY